ncbi:MAG: hypothetical protein LKCHEGNO_01321 [Burkholderiaceae bacterium]|nr:hypothetical protein [Burkholderiaceae bacterium]
MTTLTTLIPAYKGEYLGEVFLGLRTQCFTDFRIVLSDDSPGGAITDQIRRGAFDALIDRLDLTVVQGPRLGAFKNIQHLLRHWGRQTPLVHLHMDDDVIYPDFYRLHAMAHASLPLGASVSQRWLTGIDGRPVAALPLPEAVEQHSHRVLAIGGDALLASTLPHCQNWLGEFSNTVLAQAAVHRLLAARIGDLSYYGLADIGVLLDVSEQASIAFLRDHLSGFRSHPQQSTAQTQSHGLKCGYLAWVALALGAHGVGRIDEAQLQSALAITFRNISQRYASDPAFADFFALMQAHAARPADLRSAFARWWHQLLQSHTDSCDEPNATLAAA